MLQKALMTFAQSAPTASCSPVNDANGKGMPAGSFFGLPHWYQYLPGQTDPITGKCLPTLNTLNDIWAIGLALVDMLLVVGGIAAVGFVIWGGFQYMTSQGEPDKTAAAKNTIMNALIGLVIIMLAITIVSFIGNHF